MCQSSDQHGEPVTQEFKETPLHIKIVTASCLLNFVVFVLVANWLGGDAVNGHVEAGHYFLASKGRATEVSREVFQYSRWHVYLLWANFLVAFVLSYRERRRKEL